MIDRIDHDRRNNLVQPGVATMLDIYFVDIRELFSRSQAMLSFSQIEAHSTSDYHIGNRRQCQSKCEDGLRSIRKIRALWTKVRIGNLPCNFA